jgi:hypothetical protein
VEAVDDAEFRPLAVQQPQPLARLDVAAAIELAKDFERLKSSVLDRSDFSVIQGNDVPRAKGWAKIATALRISIEILSKGHDGHPGVARNLLESAKGGKIVSFSATVRATSPAGVFVDMVGRCDSSETKHAQTEHKLEQVALTRARSNAIARLVGGAQGRVAEDVEDDRDASPAPAPPARVTSAQLAALAGAKGIPALGPWLRANLTTFAEPRKVLTPEESVRAADLLRAMPDVVQAEDDEEEAPRYYEPGTSDKITGHQRGLIFALVRKIGLTEAQRKDMYMQITGKASTVDLTKRDAKAIIDHLTALEPQ